MVQTDQPQIICHINSPAQDFFVRTFCLSSKGQQNMLECSSLKDLCKFCSHSSMPFPAFALPYIVHEKFCMKLSVHFWLAGVQLQIQSFKCIWQIIKLMMVILIIGNVENHKIRSLFFKFELKHLKLDKRPKVIVND